jgi:translation elongation factor EF-4
MVGQARKARKKHEVDGRSLFSKQGTGKKRINQVGQVDFPQEAFLAVLESDQ